MNLERIALMRAQEMMDGGSWRHPEDWVPSPVPQRFTATCAMCHAKGITARNTSRICRDCYHNLSPRRRREWLKLVRKPKPEAA